MRGAGVLDAALEATVVGSFSRIGYEVRSRIGRWSAGPSLADTRILLTGGSSGVGLAAARALSAAGARVAITGRDRARLDAAADGIADVGRRPVPVVADAQDLEAVRSMFHEAVDRLDGLDVLINNAGALTHAYTRSPQGFEQTYAVHVLAPFLLTELAVPVVGPEGRVITVSSGGMYTQALRPDMQMAEADYDGVVAYARAKRAQVVLTQEWARRHPSGPLFAAMHPGWADTPGVRDSLPSFRRLTRPILRTPEQGADTVVWLAGAQIPSGRFWLDRHERSPVYLPRTRYSPAAAAALFDTVADQVAQARV